GGDGTISEVVNGLLLANEELVAGARVAAAESSRLAAQAKAALAAEKAAEKAAARAAKQNEAVAAAALVAEGEAMGAEGGPASSPQDTEPVAPEAATFESVAAEIPALDAVVADAAAAEPPVDKVGEEPDAEPDPDPEFTFVVPPELEVAGTLGVVPVGSGNDFASMVGIPLEMAAAVKMLERQRLRLVDVGSANVICAPGSAANGSGEARSFHRYFDNNMGIGLEASVIIESNKIRRLRGALLYATAAVRALFKHRSPRMHVRWTTQAGVEGSHDKPTLLVSVGNSRRAGGGFFLTPDAVMDDKQLDVAIADDISRPAVMALLPRALQGKHTTHPAVTMLRIEKLTIQVPDGAPIQMDGEIVEEHACAVEIRVLPHKLELIA
ncbi:MAG: diacylglycerol/lipid kinase family protein, partial [Caldilineaceae bacterium]